LVLLLRASNRWKATHIPAPAVIEGAEDQALEGVYPILAGLRPSMIVEVHGKEKEDRYLSILRGHGCTPIIVDRRKLFAEWRPIDHNCGLICPGRDVAT
jgi:hypothetical protein